MPSIALPTTGNTPPAGGRVSSSPAACDSAATAVSFLRGGAGAFAPSSACTRRSSVSTRASRRAKASRRSSISRPPLQVINRWNERYSLRVRFLHLISEPARLPAPPSRLARAATASPAPREIQTARRSERSPSTGPLGSPNPFCKLCIPRSSSRRAGRR